MLNIYWFSVDVHFQEEVAILSLAFCTIKVANAWIIREYRCRALWLSNIQDQKSFMLHWRSLLEDSTNGDSSIFTYQRSQYYDYVSQPPTILITVRLTKLKVFDNQLTLISRAGQWACLLQSTDKDGQYFHLGTMWQCSPVIAESVSLKIVDTPLMLTFVT